MSCHSLCVSRSLPLISVCSCLSHNGVCSIQWFIYCDCCEGYVVAIACRRMNFIAAWQNCILAITVLYQLELFASNYAATESLLCSVYCVCGTRQCHKIHCRCPNAAFSQFINVDAARIAMVAGGFAAQHPAGRIYNRQLWCAVGAMLQALAHTHTHTPV